MSSEFSSCIAEIKERNQVTKVNDNSRYELEMIMK
jgi:hypothetical protein